MRYFAGYIYGSDDTDGGGSYIGLYDDPVAATCAAWAWVADALMIYGRPQGDYFLRADVYAYDGPLSDPYEIWETLPPLYTGENGDVCHICASTQGIDYTPHVLCEGV